MSKHTKGPWEVRADWIVGFNGALHVATIPRAFDGDYSEANALLIAAAPDLLAACKEALRMVRNCTGNWTLGVEDMLERAIAKAEGTK